MQYDAKRGAWVRAGAFIGAAGLAIASQPRARGKSRSSVATSGGRNLDLVINDMAFSKTRWYAATGHGLFFSADRGARWHLLPLGSVPDLPVSSVRVSDDAQSLWVVSLRGLVFSTDGGRTWAWHDLPLSAGGALRLELAPSPLEPQGRTLVATAHNGLFISRDSGSSWQQAASGLPELPIEDLAVVDNLFVASLHAGGLFVSLDRGLNWNRVKGTVAQGFFPAVAAEGSSVTVLAASANDGIYAVVFTPDSKVAIPQP